MNKRPDNRHLAPPATLVRVPAVSRRRSLPRFSAAADGTESSDAFLQFPSELESPSFASEPAVLIAHIAPVAPPAASRRSPVRPRHASRPLIWLGIAFAASASLVWIANRYSDRGVPLTARSSSPSTPASKEQRVLAAAASTPPIDRVVPAVAVPIAAKPSPAPSRVIDRKQRRPREAARAAALHTPTAAPPAPATTFPGFRGGLVVDSEPAGARVFVNGQAVGATPLVLHEIPAGSRVVRIEADGYASWSSAIRIVANEQTRVAATLLR